MKYYQRNLGDYARDTGHLTALEHGVFNLLLDWYYANERPIPESLIPAIARGEVEAARNVLPQFFKLTRNGWLNSHAERIILEYQAKCDRNRAVGKLGGRPKKTQTDNSGFPKKTLSSIQYPVSNKEQKKKHAPPAGVDLVFEGISEQVARDFLALRAKLRAPLTATALAGIKREAQKAGMTLEAALSECCERSWRGFKAEWMQPKPDARGGPAINTAVPRGKPAPPAESALEAAIARARHLRSMDAIDDDALALEIARVTKLHRNEDRPEVSHG